MAQPKSLEGALPAKQTPTLSLLLPSSLASPNFPADGQGLVLANFNEDDATGATQTLAARPRAGVEAPALKLAIPNLQRPVLTPPSAAVALPGLNQRAPALSLSNLPSVASLKIDTSGLDVIPQITPGTRQAMADPSRGLQAEGGSLRLSLFGHSQVDGLRYGSAPGLQADPAGDVTKGKAAVLETNTAIDAGISASDPKNAEATKVVIPKERPSAALIDPQLKVASLNDDVGILPSYQAPASNRASHSFPRLDISVALYAMDEPLPKAQRADRVLVEKGARLLHLFEAEQLVKSYRIDLGFSPVGHKLAEGDGKTPEGDYRIDWRKKDSEFYRALHISYPSEQDASIAKFSGRDPGGAIMIHGRPNGFSDSDPLAADWTAGCIAVLNAAIEEIWAAVDDGAPIRIRP